jgi:hypothetical protein
MDSAELDTWVGAYIEANSSSDTVELDHPQWWAIQRFLELEMDQPEQVWAAILLVNERTTNERVIGVLAAGPLEDLIENHGAAWIDRIELEASRNPKFQHLLGGVWESGTPEIWTRVEKARVKAW